MWGGCIESLTVQASAGKYLPKNEDLEDAVLYIETAEDIPEPWIVKYLLIGFGERGWLDKFKAVLVGRAKAWEMRGEGKQKTTEEKAEYRREQRETVIKTVRQYNQTIPIVQNLDFGHTDPQVCMPSGNTCRIDGTNQKIYLIY